MVLRAGVGKGPRHVNRLSQGAGSAPVSSPALLMESASYLLLEDGSKILLE